MAIKFQYNKTSLQVLEKQLKVRKRTLPIIKSKESALRMEVKKCKDDLVRLERELEEGIGKYDSMFALWNEFNPGLVKVKDVHLTVRKIAGTRIPLLDKVDFEVAPFSLFSQLDYYSLAVLHKQLDHYPLLFVAQLGPGYAVYEYPMAVEFFLVLVYHAQNIQECGELDGIEPAHYISIFKYVIRIRAEFALRAHQCLVGINAAVGCIDHRLEMVVKKIA